MRGIVFMAPDGNFNQFDTNAQPFDPVTFFAGTFRAQGMFVDRFGQLQKRFIIDILCDTKNKQTTLHEKFTYDDGETETRSWTIVKQSDDEYTAHTDDVVGKGVGYVEGAVFKLKYDFLLTLYGRRVKVRFDDVMVKQSENTILNKAKVSKFGLLLGELFITFSRT